MPAKLTKKRREENRFSEFQDNNIQVLIKPEI
jgi:hypothetical protein